MNLSERLSSYLPKERRARRNTRINGLAEQIKQEIINRDGPLRIGQRMRLSTEQKEPEQKEHPLTQQLLDKTENHPLIVLTLRFSQRVLPVEYFTREDKKTPYIHHAERTALLYLDLLPKNMSLIKKMIQVGIMLGHDSEEVPQERYMENLDQKIDPHERGGLTQEEVRKIFDEEMAKLKLSKRLKRAAEKIYAGIHDFNCNNPDNSPIPDAQYLRRLKRKGHAAKKVVDRGMDSPMGDMSRTVGEFERALASDEFNQEHMDRLTQVLHRDRFPRLARSTDKARRLIPFAGSIRRSQRNIKEFLEATVRAGDTFEHTVYERFQGDIDSRLAASGTIYRRSFQS